MNTFDLLFINSQIRHKELLQMAGQERLIKAILKDRSTSRNLDVSIMDWIRNRFPRKSSSEQNTCEQHPSTNLSCSMTNIQTR